MSASPLAVSAITASPSCSAAAALPTTDEWHDDFNALWPAPLNQKPYTPFLEGLRRNALLRQARLFRGTRAILVNPIGNGKAGATHAAP